MPNSAATTFAFTFPYQSGSTIAKAHVLLTTHSKANVSVTVSIPGTNFADTITINSATSDRNNVTLPRDAVISEWGSGVHIGKVVVVKSTKAVSVHGFYESVTSAAGFVVLPTDVLGDLYVVVAYNSIQKYSDSELVVAAFQDYVTNVTLTFSDNSKVFDVTLNQYESYQHVAAATSGLPRDITGAFINSTQLVSVMSGHQDVNIPLSSIGADYIMDHLAPVTSLGRRYVLAPFMGRSSGYTFRVIAVAREPTQVTISDGSVLSLQPGKFYQGDSNSVVVVNADKPVMVAQYAKSYHTDLSGVPFMIVLPSTDAYSDHVIFPVATFNIYINDSPTYYYISIVITCEDVENLMLDGRFIGSASGMLQTHDEEFCVLRQAIQPGIHNVGLYHQREFKASFVVLVYGYTEAVGKSYGYVAGYNVKGKLYRVITN